MTRSIGKIGATILATTLAFGMSACSDRAGLNVENMIDRVVGYPAGQGTGATPTAAQRSALASGGSPQGTLQVIIPAYNARAELSLLTSRGDIQDWRASDGSSIVMSDGMLVGTRGLGADLFSAEAPGLIRALLSGRGTVKRQHLYLDGEGATSRVLYVCSVSIAKDPPKRVGMASAGGDRHLVEHCVSELPKAVEFTNIYWLSSGDKEIKRSRQWVSTKIGSIDIAYREAR